MAKLELDAHRKAYREEMIRRGVSECEGALFRATVSDSVRWTIDSKAVKAEMGARGGTRIASNRSSRLLR